MQSKSSSACGLQGLLNDWLEGQEGRALQPGGGGYGTCAGNAAGSVLCSLRGEQRYERMGCASNARVRIKTLLGSKHDWEREGSNKNWLTIG